MMMMMALLLIGSMQARDAENNTAVQCCAAGGGPLRSDQCDSAEKPSLLSAAAAATRRLRRATAAAKSFRSLSRHLSEMQRLDVVIDGRRQTMSATPSFLAVQTHTLPTSWHAHDYRHDPPDRAPTPHLIRNILGLDDPRPENVQPCLDSSLTCSVRSSASLVSSSSVGPDDDRHIGSRGHVDPPINGLGWSTSGPRRAGHLGNSLTTSSAADTTLRG